jgi:transposase
MKDDDLVIEMHLSVEDLNKEIRELEQDVKTLNRLHLIKQIYRTNSIAESCEILDIPLRTGYNWVKKWDEGGPDGLRHKKGAGRVSFLSKEQFQELDKWMEKEEFLITHDVYLYIKENFGIEYSKRQVIRIVHQLDYTWVKPYPIADDQVPDAKEILKNKTECIDPENDIYGFIDETAVQNTPNVSRIIKKKGPVLK